MKKIIIGVIVLALIAGGGYFLWRSQVVGNAAPEPAPVADAGTTPTIPPVKAGDQVVADAVVEPIRSAELSLATGGIVAEVLVAEGEAVEEGEIILRLDSKQQAAAVAQAEATLRRAQASLAELKAGARSQEIEAQRAAIAAAEAQREKVDEGALPEEIAAAKAALASAQTNYEKLMEGPEPEDIAAGEAALVSAQAAYDDLLKGKDEEEIKIAQAALKQAEINLQLAQSDYDQVAWVEDIGARQESLRLQQATLDYESAKANYDLAMKEASDAELKAAAAQIAAAKAELARLRDSPTAEEIAAAQAQIAQAKAELARLERDLPADTAAANAEIRRAKANLALTEAGARPETIAAAEADIAAAEAAMQQAQVALQDTELRAPFAGTIAWLDAKEGEQVSPGVSIVQLADLSAWQIETDDLTELSVVRVNEGDPVAITFDAIPDLELPGKVQRIKLVGENKQGDITYTVIVIPDEHDARLRWKMTAVVTIEPRD